MNDDELKKILNSVGKECFVNFFEDFSNLQLSNKEIAQRIDKEKGYTLKSCNSRTSHARSIIKSDKSGEALRIIASSKNTKTQEKALELIQKYYQKTSAQIKTGKIKSPSNDVTPSKKDVIERDVEKNMAIEFIIWKKDDLEHNETYAKVNKVAEELCTFLCKSDIQKELRACHKPGASSAEIQKILLPKVTELGFESEKEGLFKEYSTSSLRPDYYLPIYDTGIILEVERGKTIINNMVLLDLWKCHICKYARYLFLIVPQERTDEKGKRTKQFVPARNRLKTFFEPVNYVNVDAVFLFGY